MTIFSLILVTAYGVRQTIVLINYGNTTFQTDVNVNHYSTTDGYTPQFEDPNNFGFNIAFGIYNQVSNANIGLSDFDRLGKFVLKPVVKEHGKIPAEFKQMIVDGSTNDNRDGFELH